MWLGLVESACERCEQTEVRGWWGDLQHDARCWGAVTAALNLWARLTWPQDEWDGYCEDCGRPGGVAH